MINLNESGFELMDQEIEMSEGSSEFNINTVHNSRSYETTNEAVNKTELNCLPMDITLRCFPLNIRNFLVCKRQIKY